MLRYKSPAFYEKSWFLKTVKSSYIPTKSLLYLQICFTNKNKNYIFMIRKDWSICDQNLDILSPVAITQRPATNAHTPHINVKVQGLIEVKAIEPHDRTNCAQVVWTCSQINTYLSFWTAAQCLLFFFHKVINAFQR